ncbi:MAG: helix-turn-helix domain-containing protein [Tannerellaceae bacterium]|nr:helix-turn-helix domain-containing protein [Tannerellaceae bacterium]
MISVFAANKNRLITKEYLAEHVWSDNIDMADNYSKTQNV